MRRALPLLLLLAGCPEGPGGGFADDSGRDEPAVDDDDCIAPEPDPEDDDDSVLPPVDDDDVLPPPPPTTLVTIDDTTHELVVVDETTGVGTPATPLSSNTSMCSTIFTRAGNLYTSSGNRLWQVDPCSGDVQLVAPFPEGASICGLAARDLNALYAVNRNGGQLVSVDVDTAELTPRGPTGVNWGAHGLTWDPKRERFLGINSRDNGLYAINPNGGQTTLLSTVDLNFQTVGIEVDPISGVLYACTGPDLYVIEPDTGAATLVGPIHEDPSCDDLGATWVPPPCLE